MKRLNAPRHRNPRARHGALPMAATLFAAALFATPLGAQLPLPTPKPVAATPRPSTIDKPILNLPPGWKVIGEDTDPSNAPNNVSRTPSTDPRLVNLLLTAAPEDANRKITLSFYRYRFREYGLPTSKEGLDWESAKFLQAILMQGYVPEVEESTQGVTLDGLPTVLLKVTAKNAVGDERIFTEVATSQEINSYRVYASCPASDTGGIAEIDFIIKSLNVTGSATATAQGAPGQPAAVAPSSAQATQVLQDYQGALVIVDGNKMPGSGFLCNIGGQTCIITNAHVLAGNTTVKLTNLEGTSFTAGKSAVAVDHDIVKMEVPAMPRVFELMTDFTSNVKIGDAVTVPGNAQGGKVVTSLEGKIVGIGPNLVEVDAPFTEANSGSPIVHVATGKVLGIATYVHVKKMGTESSGRQNIVQEVRRFGYRLDSVKEWQPVSWPAFYQEAAQLKAIESLSADFIALFNDHGSFSAAVCTNPELVRKVKDFTAAGMRGGKAALSKADEDELKRHFLTDLQGMALADIKAFNAQPSYDYFHGKVDEQAQFRQEVVDALSRILQDQ